MTESILTAMDTELLLSNEWIKKYVSSEHYVVLENAIRKTDWSIMYVSPVHGTSHIERVMALGSMICMQQGLDIETTDLVMTACAYHDIARANDAYDYGHGRRSANKLEELSDQLNIHGRELSTIQAAIAVHSTNDDLLDEFMTIYGVDEPNQCRVVAKVLKDADGLDRVRISDLDPSYLRFDESKELIEVAVIMYITTTWPWCTKWPITTKRIIDELIEKAVKKKDPHEGIR